MHRENRLLKFFGIAGHMANKLAFSHSFFLQIKRYLLIDIAVKYHRAVVAMNRSDDGSHRDAGKEQRQLGTAFRIWNNKTIDF